MNIQALTPNFLQNRKSLNTEPNSTVRRSNLINSNANTASYPQLRALENDTVSFGMRKINELAEPAISAVGDFVEKKYDDSFPILEVLSGRLQDSMMAIASELEDVGLVFDKVYNSKAPIKSKNSYMSKFVRSCAEPRDPVRNTWYLRKLHDLPIFVDNILPALRSRGYEIAAVPGKKKLPDFDVRLSGVPEKAKDALPKELRDVASFKKQASGYEDIQFRVVDKLAKDGKKTPLEIIIVAGENTAKAKANESYYVYDITRVLKKELHISEIKDPEIHTPAYRVKSNIEIITDQLNDNISKPLYTNARALDIDQDASNLRSVGLDENSAKVLTGLAEGINNKIPLHYKAKIKEIKDDKALSLAEKRARVERLKKEMEDDLNVIDFVKTRLKETIEKYGTKS